MFSSAAVVLPNFLRGVEKPFSLRANQIRVRGVFDHKLSYAREKDNIEPFIIVLSLSPGHQNAASAYEWWGWYGRAVMV